MSLSYLQKLRERRGLAAFPEDTVDMRALENSAAIRHASRAQRNKATVSFSNDASETETAKAVSVEHPAARLRRNHEVPSVTPCNHGLP